MIRGLGGSYSHPENGMVRSDMEATLKVAERLREVIAFRSTGPWAKRWIEAGHPTKNFHVKGKSSDWGPQAGLVPFKGVYSKVGHDKQKAADGTKANQKGIESGFAGKITLRLTEKMLKAQLQRSEEAPPRTAIERQEVIDDNRRILIAKRSGDQKVFAFLAKKVSSRDRYYKIYAFPPGAGTNAFKLLKHLHHVHPLEVMTSGEVGADRPMTGDYDLLAVCPRWADYGGEMISKGEGFPFTSFQPQDLHRALGDVCTMENMTDFNNWMEALKAAGYYVPKNWAWSQTEAPKAKFKRLFGRGPEYLPERH